ncbi:hypothetical protein Poly51_07120 [Rubripirellula tenax]|uniref:Uncharacterized protein n=2 Tax=Rubripirellula tenax TaxID=2528015 RepID=A0A5C6FF50_9BACT|nr:hypothetical protein Poly51_07120 [Rubripirellula tenax]
MALMAPSAAMAQSPAGYPGGLRPVPREGTRMITPQPTVGRAAPALQWRRSPNVAPQPVGQAAAPIAPQRQAVAAQRQAATPQTRAVASQSQVVAANQQAVAPASGLQVSTDAPSLRSVSQAAWMTQPARVDELLSLPSNLRIAQNPSTAPSSARDFFADPFGDAPEPMSMPTPSPSSASELTPIQNTSPAFAAPPSIADDPIDDGFLFPEPEAAPVPTPTPEPMPQPQAAPTLPNESRPMNDLRDSFGFPETADPSPVKPAPQAEPAPRVEEGPSLRDMLRDNAPETEDDVRDLPAPKRSGTDDEKGMFDNPFPRRDADDSQADSRDRDQLNDPRSASGDRKSSLDDGGFDDDMKTPTGITCGDFRERIAYQTIDKISLDISPPYRPDEMEQKRYERLKDDFDEKQSIRQWRNVDGAPLASGRLRDLAYEKAVIETDFGTTEELAMNRLSEADLAYISDNWGLPKECLIEQVAYTPRTWTAMTMTWKASNLCHTPLYFEDVNLERYGHTHGPVLEPFVQTAHFFGNIAVLPYKMGVHQPNECTYSLGYYRPGNCAPWITPPIPISLRGALYQTAAVTGAFWLLP